MTTTMVAATYSSVDTIEGNGMCNIRSEKHFNISDGGIERGARRAVLYIAGAFAAASPSWVLLNLEQSNISGEETASFNARSNLESRCPFFSDF